MALTVKTEWNGKRVTGRARAGAVTGLELAAEHVLGVSRQLVPLEEATLERSGVASVDEVTMTAAVSYDTVYAARQHEEMTWRHDEGRQAKYLETPMSTEADTVAALIRSSIRKALGS